MTQLRPPGSTDTKIRWSAIALFVGIPWFLGLAHWLVRPPPPGEVSIKLKLLAQRGPVDTFVIGESRSLRLGGEPFSRRGWRHFNLALSGLSPEHSALQLVYALEHHKVRRVIMGVSFENMAHTASFFSSQHSWHPAFAELSLEPYCGAVAPANPDVWEPHDLLPVGRAASTARYYLLVLSGVAYAPRPFLNDGRAAYVRIQQQFDSATFDSVRNRDPKKYFRCCRGNNTERYLQQRVISKDAQHLYSGLFRALRRSKIPCIVFETGRTHQFQKLIDEEPVLSRLQKEWRSFYRSESRGSVKFLPIEHLGRWYDQNDFFDAVHTLGETPRRLSEKLATELETLEATVSSQKKEPTVSSQKEPI